MAQDTPFRLFLSYAHDSEATKDRLLTHLAPLMAAGLVKVWQDRAISMGDDWKAEIDTAMAESDAVLFLVDANFLASKFCLEVEVATFLQRHHDEGLLILFVHMDHCGWEHYDFIRQFQMAPRDGRPITDFRPRSKAYTAVVNEIGAALRKHRDEVGQKARNEKSEETALDIGEGLTRLLAKLPGRTTHLFGRERELEQLSEWQAHKGVLLWVAGGGFGKSALARWWLERHHHPAGTRFLGHSFYSQGSHNQATTARGFLFDALEALGVEMAQDASDQLLGERLAEEVASAPTVLLLDGLEPLQQAVAEDPKLHGTLKDRGLAALLEGLARNPGEALCLATSRLPIPDPTIADRPHFRPFELDQLAPEAALALLEQRGVKGSGDERAAMAERCGHHPLTLVLAAELGHTFLEDSAAKFLEREWPVNEEAGHHSATVMGWLDKALEEERQPLDRELARCLGLFDRPAPWGALRALQSAEPIPGVTEALHDADDQRLWEALARLQQWGLLQAELGRGFEGDEGPELDAHPLVREAFGERLEAENPEGYRAAHRVLFDWFRGLPEKEQPDTLAEMEPLYRAMGHGCRAGAYRAASQEVYQNCILHRERRYSQFQLGAWSANLAALAGFFPEGWRAPPVGGDLSEANRSWLLAEAAFCLTSVGRLEEALGPRRISRERRREAEERDDFCNSSEELASLLVILGRWAEAEVVARETLAAAERIAEGEKRWFHRMLSYTLVGLALHGRGMLEAAAAAFERAEQIQAERDHESPQLYGRQGYIYVEFLQERSETPSAWRAIRERAQASLVIGERIGHLLSQALDLVALGKAQAALGEPGALESFDHSVATMQQASYVIMQPPIHLARAHHHHTLNNPPAARSDLEAAHAIAQRGNMRTYLAECALLAGHLHLDAGELPEAAAAHAEASTLIHEDGYLRRLAELHLLAARLHHHQHEPEAARRALIQARDRIEEVGQYAFRARVREIAEELGVEGSEFNAGAES